VPAGDTPVLAPDRPLVAVSPRAVVLSALKPAEDGRGLIVRLLNPTDAAHDAVIDLGFEVTRAAAVRLDETPLDQPVSCAGRRLTLTVPAHALRSVRLE
jgi:alpha-mannosidase